nr:reverse transcriptase domain-containing protein [Tanacetum cinerariifolium]
SPRIPACIFLAHMQSQGKPERKDISAEQRKQLVELIPWIKCQKAWDRYKDLLHACPRHGFIELHQLDTFYNALKSADQDSLNSAADGNLLERRTQDMLTIIENKSKQTSALTTAMTAILKQFQATPPPASVKSIKEICVTCGGAHPYQQCLAASGNTLPKLRDNIQGYVAAAAINYNQGNSDYRPLGVANQIRPSGFA